MVLAPDLADQGEQTYPPPKIHAPQYGTEAQVLNYADVAAARNRGGFISGEPPTGTEAKEVEFEQQYPNLLSAVSDLKELKISKPDDLRNALYDANGNLRMSVALHPIAQVGQVSLPFQKQHLVCSYEGGLGYIFGKCGQNDCLNPGNSHFIEDFLTLPDLRRGSIVSSNGHYDSLSVGLEHREHNEQDYADVAIRFRNQLVPVLYIISRYTGPSSYVLRGHAGLPGMTEEAVRFARATYERRMHVLARLAARADFSYPEIDIQTEASKDGAFVDTDFYPSDFL